MLKRVGLFFTIFTTTFFVTAVCFADQSKTESLSPINDTSEMNEKTSAAQAIAKALDLEGHIEGGFFRRTYQADHRDSLETENGERFLLTSIFYMLTEQSPIGHWHLNQSDIVHYFHLGDPVEYLLLHQDGRLEKYVMGADVLNGQHLQLTVKGGIWKSSRLLTGSSGFGLISEAVSPGFDFEDMTLGNTDDLLKQFPQHENIIRALSKPKN